MNYVYEWDRTTFHRHYENKSTYSFIVNVKSTAEAIL